jgi:NADPH-dependent curcumin reductase CurA
LIFAYLPWSRYTVTKGNDQGFEKIQVPPNVSPSAALGVLGMPGMTAYFGLKVSRCRYVFHHWNIHIHYSSKRYHILYQ